MHLVFLIDFTTIKLFAVVVRLSAIPPPQKKAVLIFPCLLFYLSWVTPIQQKD